MLAEALIQLLANCTNGFFLIVAVSDLIINGNFHQILSLAAAVHQLLQIVLAEDTADLPLGARLVIPEIGFKAVGGKHHWAASEFTL